jgi:hypothetical protein
MSKENHAKLSLDMAEAQKKFKHWRRTRTSHKPIPEELWQTAVGLSKNHSTNHISKVLCLNHTDLKHRIQATPEQHADTQSFIELDCSSTLYQTSECVIEMMDGNGAQMNMYFKGEVGIDLLRLGKAFWEKKK